ncbi:hypothetical protein MMC13_005317 [Lambiella insularis]|nr:hypothetical protein [Lambiella insularis]
MFNAVNGLGGGGQFDPVVANNSNVALYSIFSVVGFFAGTIVNRLGIKWSLSFGGFGYFIYIASYLSYNHNTNAGFVIFAGALLGVCAGLLCVAQGAIMMSFPPEGSKGKYISWFWTIFNLGGVIGSLVPLGQNINSSAGSVNDGTYIGFMILTFIGAALAWCLVDARPIQRADGSHVIIMNYPTWQSEIIGLWEVLISDSYIVLLFPLFFASNWFYTYQFNNVNLARFNIRMRALNNTLYWISQIFGAYIFGGYVFQKDYTRAETTDTNYVKMDWTTGGYVGPMFLYMFYGFFDAQIRRCGTLLAKPRDAYVVTAAWQTSVYWYIGTLSNNSRKLANFAGFYKGIQSAGAAIIYRIDALGAPYMNEFASCWTLLAGSLLIAAPVIVLRIKDTVPLEEDLKFSEETIEDVKGLRMDTELVRE